LEKKLLIVSEVELLAMPKQKIIVCIPARYGSTRFPGKVLAKDTGKFLIQHVYEQARRAKLPDKVIIAADDKRIADAAKSFGAECIMTSPDCASGTDRIAQAIVKIRNSKFEIRNSDVIVNLQADEPEIDPANVDAVAQLLLDNPGYSMATLAADFETKSQIADPNIVKVVTSHEPRATSHSVALYFSRSVIPYDRRQGGIGPVKNYLRHLGIYAYRKDFLLKITKLPQTPLEKIEKLEQLRAVENGFNILVAKVKPPPLCFACPRVSRRESGRRAKRSSGGAGIDTHEQYAEFVKRYKRKI
jgi:3-deoxy-manno-octulosonate cytidylyltransferase (CMP-KDO synthetase)